MSSSDLTIPSSFKAKNLVFSKAVKSSIPNMNPPVNFHRINVKIKQGTQLNDLFLPTSMLYSFGIQQNENPDTGKVNGYSVALCMWNRDNPTEEEKKFTSVLDEIVEECKDYLLKNKDEIEKYDLESSDLKKLNPLWWKREKGKIVEGRGPMLYPKLTISKKDGIKILTPFADDNSGKDLDPHEIIGKYMNMKAVIKIESIFIGNKISLQIKVDEAVVRLAGQQRTRRLTTQVKPQLEVTNQPLQVNNDKEESDSESEEENKEEVKEESDSDISSDEEKVEEPPKTTRKKVVRKKVVKK